MLFSRSSSETTTSRDLSFLSHHQSMSLGTKEIMRLNRIGGEKDGGAHGKSMR